MRPASLGFAMRSVLPTEPAVFAEFELVGRILLVFRRRVIALLALGAGKGNDIPHDAKSLKATPRA